MDSTMLIFAMDFKGTAVAMMQAATDTIAASAMDNSGNAVSCRLSLAAALIRTVHIYPETAPIKEAISP